MLSQLTLYRTLSSINSEYSSLYFAHACARHASASFIDSTAPAHYFFFVCVVFVLFLCSGWSFVDAHLIRNGLAIAYNTGHG